MKSLEEYGNFAFSLCSLKKEKVLWSVVTVVYKQFNVDVCSDNFIFITVFCLSVYCLVYWFKKK